MGAILIRLDKRYRADLPPREGTFVPLKSHRPSSNHFIRFSHPFCSYVTHVFQSST